MHPISVLELAKNEVDGGSLALVPTLPACTVLDPSPRCTCSLVFAISNGFATTVARPDAALAVAISVATMEVADY